ncbi:MAG: phosphoglycerate mutase family protein [bacterium]
MTKNVIIRHAETKNNETHTHDSFSKTNLNKNGQKQAKQISKELETFKKDDWILIMSPLSRTIETVMPFLEKTFPDSMSAIESRYKEIQKIYQDLWAKKEIQ